MCALVSLSLSLSPSLCLCVCLYACTLRPQTAKQKAALQHPNRLAFNLPRPYITQRALRDRLMSRGKSCLPTVSRQFLTRNYPRPNCLLKCLPNCLSPTREGFLSSFKINPAVRVIARQVRDKNCLAAIFAPRHQSVSQGPLGRRPHGGGGWEKEGGGKRGKFFYLHCNSWIRSGPSKPNQRRVSS